MNMAKATAALISEKLRHACGARVECVIADTCIAGMAESAACEEKFSNQNVGVTITVTPAGATAAKPSTWIRCARRPSGALTAPSVRGGLSGRGAGGPARKGSRRSPSTDMTCRMPMTRRSQRMSKKSCCASHAPARCRQYEREKLSVAGRRLNGHRRIYRRPQLF